MSATPGRGFTARLFVLLALAAIAHPATSASTPVTADIEANTTWTTAGSPYVVETLVSIDNGATLTIEPGVVVKFDVAAGLLVGSATESGTLIADGDTGPGAPAQIVFTSSLDDTVAGDTNLDGTATSPSAGDWFYVYVHRMATSSTLLRNVSIRYSGRSGNGSITVDHDNATITIDDVTIQDSGGEGIHLLGGATSQDVTISDCTISNTVEPSIHVASSASITGSISNCALEDAFYAGVSSDLSWSGNSFTNWGARISRVAPEAVADITGTSTFDAPALLEILAGTQTRDATWTTDAGTLVLLGSVTVQGTDGGDGVTTLTLDPGLVMKIGVGFGLVVGTASVKGALVADGDTGPGAPSEIVLTSTRDDATAGDTNGDGTATSAAAGDWLYLYVHRQAEGTTLRNVRVRYAGRFGNGALTLDHDVGTMTVSDFTIEESGGDGIAILQGASADSVIDDLAISGHAADGIDIDSGGLTLSNCSISTSAGDHSIDINNNSSIAASSVSSCALESVFYGGESPEVSWTSITFTDFADLRSQVEPDAVGELLANATFDAVVPLDVTTGDVLRDATWTTELGPYRLIGSVEIIGSDGGDGVTTLTLDPGVVVKTNVGFGLIVGSSSQPGALIADGNTGPGAPSQVVFTSSLDDSVAGDTNGDGTATSPAAGDWLYLYLHGGAVAPTILRNASIRYAGRFGNGSLAVDHDDASIAIDDVTIRDSGGEGIHLLGGSTSQSVTISDCSISDTADYGIRIGSSASISGSISNCTLEDFFYEGVAPALTWSGNTFDNWGLLTSRAAPDAVGGITGTSTINPVAGAILEVLAGTVTQDATWTDDAGPIVMTGSLRVQGPDGGVTDLTLDDGVELRFPGSAFLLVGNTSGDPGRLVLDGNTGVNSFNTVNLTSTSASPSIGDWEGIFVYGNGTVEIYEAQVRYADVGLDVSASGTVTAIDGLTVNRANVGVDLQSGAVVPVAPTPLNRLLFKQCDIGLRSDVDVTIRNSNLVGTTFGVQNLLPATACVDASMNWWDHSSGPSGSAPALGCEVDTPPGTGSPISDGVLFDGFLSDPADDGDSIPPGSDNCKFVANESQADVDGDGVGDACDGNPILRVSTDPDDDPDFSNLQDAVDAVLESGTRIFVFPGESPPYFGSVRLDRQHVLSIYGTQGELPDGSTGPVILDGLGGPALRIVNTAPLSTSPTVVRDLTLRGAQGITSAVSLDVSDVIFESVTAEALELTGGDHTVSRSEIKAGAAVGADVAAAATLTMSRVSMLALTDAGVIAEGDVTLENVLIGGGNGADGVRVGASGSAVIGYSTIVDNTGVGLDNSLGGTATVDRSIFYDNVAGDLVSVLCASVTWSLVGDPDCSSVGNNLALDPLVDASYRLTATSPCLDHGPSASGYTGTPRHDLDGGPRLRDHDGDGEAQNDCGAFERENTALVPGEVQNLRFTSLALNDQLEWDAEPAAVEYHVYRQDVASLAYTSFATCNDGLDSDRTDTMLVDATLPAAGSALSYLVTAEDGLGNEGTLGLATGAERSNFTPCP